MPWFLVSKQVGSRRHLFSLLYWLLHGISVFVKCVKLLAGRIFIHGKYFQLQFEVCIIFVFNQKNLLEEQWKKKKLTWKFWDRHDLSNNRKCICICSFFILPSLQRFSLSKVPVDFFRWKKLIYCVHYKIRNNELN